MKISKKNIWKLILSSIILVPIIWFIIAGAFLDYKTLSLILGVEIKEAECVDSESTWLVNYDVYKLPDDAVKKFLEKENKELGELEGYKKLNWTRWSVVDSLCRMTDSLRYTAYDLDSKVYSLYRNLSYIDSLRYPIDSLNNVVFSLSNIVDSLCNIVYPLRYLNDPLCLRVNYLSRTINSLSHVAYSTIYPVDTVSNTVTTLRNTVTTLRNTVDSLYDIVDPLRRIEENLSSGFGNDVKIINHIQTIRTLFYKNSYYALHYKRDNMLFLYILDEKNKLLYIIDYWL